jgi:hypothetical protein
MIGDIVHYVSRGSADGVFPATCRAAIVTAVHDNTVDDHEVGDVALAVLNPTGLFFDLNIAYNYEGAPGTWHDSGECDQ